MTFQPGDVVVRRGLFPDGRIASLQCGRVVSDDERGLMMWVAAGSATVRRTTVSGAPTRHLPYVEELRTPTICGPSTWLPYNS